MAAAYVTDVRFVGRHHRCSFGLAVTPAACCNTAAEDRHVVNPRRISAEDLQLPLGDETSRQDTAPIRISNIRMEHCDSVCNNMLEYLLASLPGTTFSSNHNVHLFARRSVTVERSILPLC